MTAPLPPEPLAVAVRAFTVPVKPRRAGKPWQDRMRWPDLVLVFDTETLTDATQALRFGWYRIAEWGPPDRNGLPSLSVLEEGLIYADELPTREPDGYALLRDYATKHPANTAPGLSRHIAFHSRTTFVDQLLWHYGFQSEALIAGFNLPFDLSRLAVDWGDARGRGKVGAFSLILWPQPNAAVKRRDNAYRPRVIIRHLDSKRSLIEFGSAREQRRFRGHFLDLRTAVFALTDTAHTLASACEAFAVPDGKALTPGFGALTPQLVEYARQDVRATTGLLRAVRGEIDRHEVALSPTRLYSPASLAKAYLSAMGIAPRMARR